MDIPVWYMLKEKDREKLRTYQMKHYGLNLEIPQYPLPQVYCDYEQEMKRKPHYPKGRGYKG